MNIFLVEDEPWALAELVQLFKKYEQEHSVYSFPHPDDALEKAHEIRPDLVVTDITMPGMNGLELIKHLLTIDPTIKCIILSVHDEFEYAQKGIKIGVLDYLLKPVKKASLYQAIDQAIQTIRTESKQIQELGKWSYTQMLLSSDSDEGVPDSVKNGEFVLVYMETESILNVNEDFITGGETKWIKEDIKMIDIDDKRKVLLFASENHEMDELLIQIRNIYLKIKKHMNVHISYSRKEKQDRVQEVYRFLVKQTEKLARFGTSTFITPNMIEDDAFLSQSDIWVKVRILETILLEGNMMKVKECVDHIVMDLEQKKISVKQLTIFVSNMYYALTYKLQIKKGLEFNIGEIQEDFDRLKELASFTELSNWLEEIILSLVAEYSPTQISPKNLISKIIQMIHTNYQENVTFSQFANDHHVSLSYLSREFKNQTGLTFSDYLMRYRIEKAKEFFIGGIERTGEVGNLVGYEDPKHFSSIFKRVEGVSPRDYKKQLQKSNNN